MSVALETRDLSKHYGETRALESLDLRVDEGQVFAFLGPNGAGKSTTIRLLLGLQRPTRGTATVLGFDPQRDPVEVHRRIGYLPGDLALYGRLSARHHLDWFAQVRGGVDRDLQHDLCERFQVVLDRPVKDLSKGNRQKVGLVLAFAHRPPLLVLDEPTGGLDPLMQNEFERLVSETVAEGRTVFLSSHELDEVQRLADRVAIIKQGRLLVDDTVQGLARETPRQIEVRFAQPVDPTSFAGIAGVTVVAHHDRQVTLEITDSLGPALAAIAAHDPVDLVSRQADLDELFLDFYREPSQEGEAVGP